MRYLLIFLLFLVSCQAESQPTTPDTIKENIISLDSIVSTGWVLNYWDYSDDVQRTVAIGSNTNVTLSTGCIAIQLEYTGESSQYFGFCYPKIPNCFKGIPLIDDENTGPWRVVFYEFPAEWPIADRMELRGNRNCTAEVSTQTIFVRAEKWDSVSESYIESSPWFSVTFTPNSKPFHYEMTER